MNAACVKLILTIEDSFVKNLIGIFARRGDFIHPDDRKYDIRVNNVGNTTDIFDFSYRFTYKIDLIIHNGQSFTATLKNTIHKRISNIHIDIQDASFKDLIFRL